MNLRVVLVDPIYEGNIGSIARAMKEAHHLFEMPRLLPHLC